MKRLVAPLLIAFLASAGVASAAEGTASRVRGTIEQASETMLTVKSREGPSVEIALQPDFHVSGVKAAEASQIKVGDFVGVASVPTAAGGAGAVEVVIFPAAMKGTGEGSYPWDLEPNSTMTNATVSNAVENVDGRKLTLTYPDGSKDVSLPAGIPIVTFDDATKADLVTGATVFVPGTKDTAGKMSTKAVIVGKNGVVPPM